MTSQKNKPQDSTNLPYKILFAIISMIIIIATIAIMTISNRFSFQNQDIWNNKEVISDRDAQEFCNQVAQKDFVMVPCIGKELMENYKNTRVKVTKYSFEKFYIISHETYLPFPLAIFDDYDKNYKRSYFKGILASDYELSDISNWKKAGNIIYDTEETYFSFGSGYSINGGIIRQRILRQINLDTGKIIKKDFLIDFTSSQSCNEMFDKINKAILETRLANLDILNLNPDYFPYNYVFIPTTTDKFAFDKIQKKYKLSKLNINNEVSPLYTQSYNDLNLYELQKENPDLFLYAEKLFPDEKIILSPVNSYLEGKVNINMPSQDSTQGQMVVQIIEKGSPEQEDYDDKNQYSLLVIDFKQGGGNFTLQTENCYLTNKDQSEYKNLKNKATISPLFLKNTDLI
jgi:hypothetical protein